MIQETHIEQLQLAKRRLQEMRERLSDVGESADQAAATVELDQTRVGRLSRMDALQQQAMAHATGERRALQLKEIATALLRIESGDYGLCTACDEEIAKGRLEVDPAARLCITCAERAEQR